MHKTTNETQLGNRRSSIRTRILCSLLILSLIMVLSTSIISFNLASGKVKDVSLRLSESNTSSAAAELDAYMQSVHDWSTKFTQIPEIQELLLLQGYYPLSHTGLSQGISQKVMAMKAEAATYGPEFEFVSVFMENDYSHISQLRTELPFFDYQSCLEYFSLTEAGNSHTYISPSWLLCALQGGRIMLVYVRFLYHPVDLSKRGLMVFGINERWLSNSYATYAQDACIMSADGILYSDSGNAGRIGTSTYTTQTLQKTIQLAFAQEASSVVFEDEAGEERIISYKQLSAMNAFLIVPFDLYEGISSSEMHSFLRSVIIMGVLCMIATVVLSVLIARGLTRPIVSLTKFTRQVETGETALRHSVKGSDEVAYLGHQINDMLDQLALAAEQREEGLKANQALELQLNQMQINPHLLYNTLDSVLWVLQQERTADATELIASLSEFFKISLSKGRARIALKDELILIQHYLTIQRLARLTDIQLQLDIAPELENYPLIKLSLQPLVENAVIHGFTGYRSDGIVTISARRDGNDILICVTDNGIGFLPEGIANMNRIFSLTTLPEDFHHFGLFNINRRISQAYGQPYGLTIDSEIGVYSTVTMRLPYISPEKERDQNV